MTGNEQAALTMIQHFAERRSSFTSSFIASQMGEPRFTRKWAGVLTSLANRGVLVQHKDAFVGKTFWTLSKVEDENA